MQGAAERQEAKRHEDRQDGAWQAVRSAPRGQGDVGGGEGKEGGVDEYEEDLEAPNTRQALPGGARGFQWR